MGLKIRIRHLTVELCLSMNCFCHLEAHTVNLKELNYQINENKLTFHASYDYFSGTHRDLKESPSAG